jgi:hypothetical protein
VWGEGCYRGVFYPRVMIVNSETIMKRNETNRNFMKIQCYGKLIGTLTVLALAASVSYASLLDTPYTTASSGLWHLDGNFTAAVGGNGTATGTTAFGGNNGAFGANLQVGSSAGGFTAGIVQGADFAGTIDMNVYYTGATSGFLWQLNTASDGQDLMHVVVHSANGQLLLQQYNGVTSDWDSVWSTSAAAALTLNTWHNIALSWNRYAGWAEFSVDGNSVGGSGSLGSFSGFTMGSITVAGPAPWGDAWSVKNVNLDEVRVSLGTIESAFTVVTVPEPTSGALLVMGAAACGLVARRRLVSHQPK